MFRSMFLALLFVAVCATSEQTGFHTGSFVFDGQTRTFGWYVPTTYSPLRSRPLVMVLHGGSGSGAGIRRVTKSAFDFLAERQDGIIVYPDGLFARWNDGRRDLENPAYLQNIDDVGFLTTLVKRLAWRYHVDNDRMFVTGISNGGGMSMRLARSAPDTFAAIAPVASALSPELAKEPWSVPTRTLLMFGTDDPIHLFNGGEIIIFGKSYGFTVSAAAMVSYVVKQNHCTAFGTGVWLPDSDPADGTRVHRRVYLPEPHGAGLEVYVIKGGGHTWPSGVQYWPQSVIGVTSRDINASRVIWDFFMSTPRRATVGTLFGNG